MHLRHRSDGFGIRDRDSEKSNYADSSVITLWSAPGRGSESLRTSPKEALAGLRLWALRVPSDQESRQLGAGR